jgi:two-component system, NarL family, response regulator LiaR
VPERPGKPRESRRALREILIYGACCGTLVAVLRVVEHRFFALEHPLAVYGGVLAVLFAGLGIWLGLSLPRRRPAAVPAAGPFVVDEARLREVGITPRELEILGLIATGLSNREIADRLCVSENTVKTHSSRLLDKLGAKRRTQAVRIGQSMRIIP